jgi:polysaccharide transporter, PST family
MPDIRKSTVARLRQSAMMHNIVAMFGTQVATYAFPLATIPYLARVLGPATWGTVAFAQALGLYVSMVVEFGFNLSATRRVAVAREMKFELKEIVAGVTGAKIVLSIACVIVLLLLQTFTASFHEYGTLLWAGALSGIAQGFSTLWYFQGMERMKLPAVVEMSGKAVAAIGIFLFVHDPKDAWKVLALQCVCYAVASTSLLVIAYRETKFQCPCVSGMLAALRDSAAMFLFRSSVSLYTTANALILGILSTPLAVGFYSGPERIVKAILNLMTPVTQALFPRLSRLLATDRGKAILLVRTSLIVMTSFGCLLCLGTLIAAPLITRVILGPGYAMAVPVMRVLALLLPAIAVSTVLGMQWMLPLRMDGVYNKIIISAGLLNLLLASLLAAKWQQLGMACSVVISEYLVTISVCVVLIKNGMSPIGKVSTLQSMLEQHLAGAQL